MRITLETRQLLGNIVCIRKDNGELEHWMPKHIYELITKDLKSRVAELEEKNNYMLKTYEELNEINKELEAQNKALKDINTLTQIELDRLRAEVDRLKGVEMQLSRDIQNKLVNIAASVKETKEQEAVIHGRHV